MLIRLFAGPTWRGAAALGDVEVEEVPAFGHKLALLTDGRWTVGVVKDVVHRIVAGRGAADVAVLVDDVSDGPVDDAPLPLALLDGGGRGDPKAPASVPRAGPWRR